MATTPSPLNDNSNRDGTDGWCIPMTRATNDWAASVPFARKFGRAPLTPHHPDALINDVIYDRMVDPNWSVLQRTFVDKETAKAEAQRRFPTLHVPETLAVMPVETLTSPEELFDRLHPYIDTDAVAKPTHGQPRFDPRSTRDQPRVIIGSIEA